MSSPQAPADRPRWSPWRSVIALGLVSLSADMVYEGMRSVAGPFLGSLGASALLVGLVTGTGEAIALVLRLVTGRAVDRSGRYWTWTIVGYALTAVCVPLLAVAPFVGSAGLAVAVALILAERTGKAVRSPAKSAILAGIAKDVGRGRGFGVHKAIDQVGAFAGPLLLAGIAAVAGGVLWPGFLVLAVPGVASLVLLRVLVRRVHLPAEEPPEAAPAVVAAEMAEAPEAGVRVEEVSTTAARQPALPPLPRAFWLFSLAAAFITAALMTFGVFSFVIADRGILPVAAIPVLYAGAMAVEAVVALAVGLAYDRLGGRVLLALPIIAAPVPWLVFQPGLAAVVAGTVLWALATGVQDSTIKALVADLVPARALGRAYGVFAAVQGGAALAGATFAGALYADHLGLLVAGLAVGQVVALAALVSSTRTGAGGS